MGDRRPFSFRFWSSSTPSTRRRPPNQTTAPPPPATTTSSPTPPPTAESQNVGQSTASTTTRTSATPPTTESQPPAIQSTTTPSSPPTPAPPPTMEQQMADQPHTTAPAQTIPPSTEVQRASQPTTTTFTSLTDESQTSSPSPSSSEPASPLRRTARSRLPAQPSSRSRAAPQPQSKPSSTSRAAPQPRSTPSSPSSTGSQTPSTLPKAPQPRSPSRLASHSPKQTSSTSRKGTQPTSPSKESRRTTQEILNSDGTPNLASNEKGPKPAASRQEPLQPQLNAEVKSDSANDINGQTDDGTRHDEMEVMPSKLTELGTTTTPAPEKPTQPQKLDSPTISGGNKPLMELNANPGESKELKEVIQATNSEASEEIKKEFNDFLTPKSGSEEEIMEKAEIPSKPDEKELDFLTPKSGPEAQIIDKVEIPSKPDEMQTEKQEALDTKRGKLDTKEFLPLSLPSVKPTNTTTSQSKNRSMDPDTHTKSALPNGENLPSHKDIRDDISTFVNRMAIGGPKSAIYDRPVSVITLAGENRGASMQMGTSSSEVEGPVHIHRGYKINPDEIAGATTDGEGSSKREKSEDAKAAEDQPTEAYVNNNAQGINNSIVFNSSVSERNPGVHMVVTHIPKEQLESTDNARALETRKAEFNMTRTEKLTHEPTVRRRCLRGLFLEPSDSDPENNKKPRHGCRVGCKERAKENDIDVR